MSTPAQEEFDKLVSNNNTSRDTVHPEDRQDNHYHNNNNNNNSYHDNDQESQAGSEDLTEEDLFRNAQIEATMRMPAGATAFTLPPVSFDHGHSTGVKGVIADARDYQSARKSQFVTRTRMSRRSVFSIPRPKKNSQSGSETDDDVSASDGSDEEEFLQQWRESRRRELEKEASRGVRTRRTSPSARIFGRMDEVDALGYLDAIEKVGRETTVVVFVYDNECEVSTTIDLAIHPLVKKHPSVRFVKIHYEEIEFDNAAVPAILAYRNQGDLVANLTGIIEMMPNDDNDFGPDHLERILEDHRVL